LTNRSAFATMSRTADAVDKPDEYEEIAMDTKLNVHSYRVLGELPPLLINDAGEAVIDAKGFAERRKELYRTAVELQYGTQPPAPDALWVEVLYRGAKGDSYRIHARQGGKTLSFRVHLIRPADGSAHFPLIVDGDGCFFYAYDGDFVGIPRARGIGMALFDRTELAHDLQNEGRRQGPLYELYPEYTFGAIGAWAWGYARVVDAMLMLDIPNPDRIVFTGHSRGGKTALLAGVLDERAAIVNPNEACAGSTSCYRVEMEAEDRAGKICRSETGADLMKNFPFWMGEEMKKYVADPTTLPFDSHFLKAMVAPRVLFVSEAVHDIWSGPIGSLKTTLAAEEAFALLGKKENLYWYYRDGEHYHAAQDMEMLVNLMEHCFDGAPLHRDFFRRPFDLPENF